MFASRPVSIPAEFVRYNQLPKIGLRYRVKTHGAFATQADIIDCRTSRIFATLYGHRAAEMANHRAERLNARAN